MVVLPSNLHRQLAKAFNGSLGETQINRLYQHLQIINPDLGELFWDSTSSPPGIYLILEGKVRLLDEHDNLLVSLSCDRVLGQCSLFPQERLHPLRARASGGLKIGYLAKEALEEYLQPQSDLEQYLHRQALLWDLLLLYSQTNYNRERDSHSESVGDRSIDRSNTVQSNRQKLQNLLSVLPQLEKHQLTEGELSIELLKQKLWLLRRGEIIHSSGLKLTSGNLYELPQSAPPHGMQNGSSQLPQGEWLVTQPTELYSLDRSVKESIPATRPPQTNLVLPRKPPILSKRAELSQNKVKPNFLPNQESSNKLYFPSPKVKVSQWWQHLTKRYPFRKQNNRADCGITCLVMIAQYWGKNFSVNQIRSVANVNRSGTSIQGLVAAAEFLGFIPRPVKADLLALAKQELPAIAHWKGKHYVVIYKITKDRVIIADPALGRRNLTRTEFVKAWTGYTLLLTPTVKFKQTPEAKQNLSKYLELLKPYWLVLLEIMAASLLLQIIGLFLPIFTQLLLDRVVVQRSTSTLIAIGAGLIIFSLFSVVMSSLRRYLLYHTANKLDLSLIVSFITHALRLPLGYFETLYVGDITSRISENRKIRRFLTGDALITLLDVLSVFVYVSLMLWYSWQLTLLALVGIPFFAIITLFFTPFLLRISREDFSAAAKARSYLIEVLTGIVTIKSMGVERNVRWRWEDLINESVKISFTSIMIGERLQIATSTIEVLSSQFTLLFGVWLVIQDQLTIGQLVAFNMLVGNVISPFQRLISLWNDFQEILVAVERIDDVINVPPEEDLESAKLASLSPIKGHIRFEKVSFRYNLESDTNTIENLSFEVKPGQTVALVGRSGSGKTTISKLVLGLYTPTEGKIYIDERDIDTIALQSLRTQVGVVNQDTFLFGGKIIDNITIAHPHATLSEVEQACQLAGAADFINEFPLKYDTQIGEGGSLLSGGQRQRLAIARALLGQPRLLILDEATSNLDAESEKIIQNNLGTILKNQTTLVIAHRLSTIRNADLILVMDRGLLVESGTHQELMAKRGQYYYLNQQQLAINS